MAQGETYEEFVEKFKPKLTTDDCYTPAVVYGAVADWVAAEYGLNKSQFVRPFYPGGDYEAFDYSDGVVVVDNPPFSILAQIVKYYTAHGIPFFLFAPSLTLFRYGDFCKVLACNASVTYENGAQVNTSFITNLEPHEIRARSAPSLYQVVDVANRANQAETTRTLPKYVYPESVITAAQLQQYSMRGIDFFIPRAESVRISGLDSQKPYKKAIYGCGLLLSEKLTADRERADRERADRERADRERADREKADREKATVWVLSEREQDIIKKLGK